MVTTEASVETAKSLRIRTILAFFAIYVLWGTTFLAIRIAVEELPPLFAAGARFFVAGVALYAFMRFKGEVAPTLVQWRSLGIMALLMFSWPSTGPLFWAEKYVPSGVVSVLAATLPILTLILEMLILRQPRACGYMLAAATLLGFHRRCGAAADSRGQATSCLRALSCHPCRRYHLVAGVRF